MYPKCTRTKVEEGLQNQLEFFTRWAKCHRGLLIQQTFQLYDLNYLCLRKLYKDYRILMPQAEYRRRSFHVASQLLKHSRHSARIRLHCRLDLSDRAGDSLHLLTLYLHLYTDSQQLQLCSGNQGRLPIADDARHNEISRRWLMGRYLYAILSRLEERRVVMREI